MLTIEFAGPSCAGKSTLVEGLKAALTAEGLVVRSVEAAHDARPVDLARALASPYTAAWAALNPVSTVRYTGRALLRAIGLVRNLQRENGILLLDEGPMKRRRSLKHARGERLLMSGLPVPAALVIVTCDPVVRLARLRATSRPHARTVDDAEILSQPTGDIFARQYAGIFGVPLVEIDTTSGADGVNELRQKLQSVVPSLHVAGD